MHAKKLKSSPSSLKMTFMLLNNVYFAAVLVVSSVYLLWLASAGDRRSAAFKGAWKTLHRYRAFFGDEAADAAAFARDQLPSAIRRETLLVSLRTLLVLLHAVTVNFAFIFDVHAALWRALHSNRFTEKFRTSASVQFGLRVAFGLMTYTVFEGGMLLVRLLDSQTEDVSEYAACVYRLLFDLTLIVLHACDMQRFRAFVPLLCTVLLEACRLVLQTCVFPARMLGFVPISPPPSSSSSCVVLRSMQAFCAARGFEPRSVQFFANREASPLSVAVLGLGAGDGRVIVCNYDFGRMARSISVLPIIGTAHALVHVGFGRWRLAIDAILAACRVGVVYALMALRSRNGERGGSRLLAEFGFESGDAAVSQQHFPFAVQAALAHFCVSGVVTWLHVFIRTPLLKTSALRATWHALHTAPPRPFATLWTVAACTSPASKSRQFPLPLPLYATLVGGRHAPTLHDVWRLAEKAAAVGSRPEAKADSSPIATLVFEDAEI